MKLYKKIPIVIAGFYLSILPFQTMAQSTSKDFPNRSVRVVVPYVAGGPMDFIGRQLGQKLQLSMGQSFILDNRPGAGGAIGTDLVAKSLADGYTILNTSSSHSSLPVVSSSLTYDPIKDFQPITQIASSVGFIVTVRSDLPAQNFMEFVNDAKANPGKYNYGSGGVGNVMQFAAEFLNTSAGMKTQHVPFKGVGQAITELVAGRIDYVLGPATSVLPFIKSGRVKALAITSKKRWSELPDVPTVDEAGLKDFQYKPFYGYWYPAGVPKEIVNKMRNEIVKVLELPETKKAFFDQGFEVVGSTPEEFAKVITNEIELNKRLAKTIDFSEK
jgi:tripartite-type tricarboxylate transporter receptor subunit TctC